VEAVEATGQLSVPERGSALRSAWWVVFGSALALVVGNGPILLFTFGVLLEPISSEFGWQRSVLASAIAVAHILGAVAMPFVGMMIDKVGVRSVTLPAIALFGVVLASAGLLGPHPAHFILLYGLLGVLGAAHSTLSYARVISGWFDASRGRALGLSLVGIGVGAAIVPKFTYVLVANYGWRAAYCGLGVMTLLVAFPAVMIFVRENPCQPATNEKTFSLKLAISDPQFWLASVALLLEAAAINGTIAHIVPLLSDRGISAGTATTAVSAAGFALIIGRIACGFALDRFHVRYVAAVLFAIPLLGMGLLGVGSSGWLAVFAAILLGLGIGTEGDIMAYLTSRYFGISSYGAVYGLVLAFFTVGSGLGPWIMARAHDTFHDYAPGLLGMAMISLCAIGMLCALGPYRYSPRSSRE